MKDLDFVKIFDSMKQNEISEVIIKEGGKQYEIRRGGFKNMPAPAAVQQTIPAAVQQTPIQATVVDQSQDSTAQKSQNTTSSTAKSNYYEVKSPLVGTFYSSPNPDAPLFVEVGDKVTKGSTLCIVEAMKNFNEIECDVNGIVREVCANNSDLVEFGQVLFRIEEQ